MLRIFGHFVPVPALLVGLCEIFVISLALFVALGPQPAAALGHLHYISPSAQFTAGFTVLAIGAMSVVGLYNYDVFLDSRVMITKILVALALVLPAAAVLCVFFANEIDGGHLGSWAALCFKGSLAWMSGVIVIRVGFLQYSSSESFRRRIVVLGTGVRASRIAELASSGGNRYFLPKAFVHAHGDMHLVSGSTLDLDRTEDQHALVKFAKQIGAKEVVVATDDRRGMPVTQLLHCKIAGINVVDYLTFWERENGRIDIEALQPSWLIFSDGFRQGALVDAMKRVFDLAMSLILLIATVPVIALTALAIKLEGPGPVLYRQERVGYHGRPFTLLKFRSMRLDAESGGAPQWAAKVDPRVTRVGGIIRKYRIDELPQLWNVFSGQMSFVGPRPERPFFVSQLTRDIPFYDERHAVKPGITGWAQVNCAYGASLDDAKMKLAYDLYYVKNRTLFLDIVILIQTVRVILFREGAR
jgi:sugar transferase (PEP-CTERM system associated)